MPVEVHIYDHKFFQNTIKFELESASRFVDVILKYYLPSSVIDVGCGAGIYLHEFVKRGINDWLGIDGSPSAKDNFLLNKDELVIFDLAQEYQFKKKYDLGLCLEVAEHLREEDADILIKTITEASDNIIFTAATPGQGPRSIGHINEQPHSYWVKKFKDKKFLYLESRTEEMREEMKKNGVVWWIVNNLMVFNKK